MGKLATKGYMLGAVKRSGFIFKKRLGQNFLIDPNIARKIAEETYEEGLGARAIEVGPGAGAITEELVEISEKVVAVEIDPFLAKLLSDELKSENLEVINKDFLKLDIDALAESLGGIYAAVSSLPYYISTPILLKLIIAKNAPYRITATVQKEVAERIASPPGTKGYSAFTVVAQNSYRPIKLFSIPPSCFFPMPKVDSAAIALVKLEKKRFDGAPPLFFEKVVRSCFAMRRKTLENNITAAFSLSKADSGDIIQSCGISPGERAEKLEIEQFGLLAIALAKAGLG